MSVRFSAIEFRNRNNVEITVAVEAPIGTALGRPRRVDPNSAVTITVGVENCPSVLISAEDPAHGTAKQTFAMGKPKAGEGRVSYLESVNVEYTIGDFQGGVRAHTA